MYKVYATTATKIKQFVQLSDVRVADVGISNKQKIKRETNLKTTWLLASEIRRKIYISRKIIFVLARNTYEKYSNTIGY